MAINNFVDKINGIELCRKKLFSWLEINTEVSSGLHNHESKERSIKSVHEEEYNFITFKDINKNVDVKIKLLLIFVICGKNRI